MRSGFRAAGTIRKKISIRFLDLKAKLLKSRGVLVCFDNLSSSAATLCATSTCVSGGR
jgi:hypothetical protein